MKRGSGRGALSREGRKVSTKGRKSGEGEREKKIRELIREHVAAGSYISSESAGEIIDEIDEDHNRR